jgi:ATP/maltotriose-dependent transcriptional regulator MalT
VATIDALIRVDELDVALRYCSEMLVEAERRELHLLGVLGHTLRARVHRNRGDITAAVSDARLAMSEVHRSGVHPRHFHFVYATEVLVRALLDAGDVDAARDAAAPIGLVGSLPHSWHHACFLNARGVLRMRMGDVEGALADQLDCGERLAAWSEANAPARSWRSQAVLAYVRLGRGQEALSLALEGLELARRWKVPSTIARALLTVAATNHGLAAVPWLVEAESVLRGSPARLMHAQVLFELGATRWKHGQRNAAREDLAKAKALAEQCGAVQLLTALAGLSADAAGPSVSMPSLQRNAVRLTPHESRVARLVVVGDSNDEIAQKLRVSRRAIEFHLTNIYRKLGVRRRTQLSSALGGFTA